MSQYLNQVQDTDLRKPKVRRRTTERKPDQDQTIQLQDLKPKVNDQATELKPQVQTKETESPKGKIQSTENPETGLRYNRFD